MISKRKISIGCSGLAILSLAIATRLFAQSTPVTFQYFYDDLGQLTKVIDSSGNRANYSYDPVGNLVQITRGTGLGSRAIAKLNFTPQQGGPGTTVTIQGQGFSATASSDTVQFNGTPATAVSATTVMSMMVHFRRCVQCEEGFEYF